MQGAVRWEPGLALVVVAIFAFGVAVSPDFLTASNLFNLGVTSGEVAIMALPMTLIIISGEIDLSVASILGMSSALLGFLWARHWPMLAIFGMLALYRGIALIILGSSTVSNFPAPYSTIGVLGVANSNLPWNVAIFAVLAVIFGVVLHFTATGRSIYAIG